MRPGPLLQGPLPPGSLPPASLPAETVVTTQRLRLRPIQAADAPRIAQLCAGSDIPRMTLRMPDPYTLAEAQAFCRRAEGQDRRRDVTFAIETAQDGLIGVLGFFTADDLGPEVGYWLGRAWRARGLATEALAAALDWAAGPWRRNIVVSGHFADNPVSGRVLCKAGFLYTGQVLTQKSLARGEPVRVRRMIRLA